MVTLRFGNGITWPLQAAFVMPLIFASVVAQSNQKDPNMIPPSLPLVYARWVDEDVRWIITPDERKAFLRLSKNDERDQFVEQFWLRRDPTANTSRNEFKEEHYRRIAYANEHFPWQAVPGWKTDRGRIYIIYGPPDAIESALPSSQSLKASALWHYRAVTKYGRDLKFVDVCGCGDYQLETLPND